MSYCNSPNGCPTCPKGICQRFTTLGDVPFGLNNGNMCVIEDTACNWSYNRGTGQTVRSEKGYDNANYNYVPPTPVAPSQPIKPSKPVISVPSSAPVTTKKPTSVNNNGSNTVNGIVSSNTVNNNASNNVYPTNTGNINNMQVTDNATTSESINSNGSNPDNLGTSDSINSSNNGSFIDQNPGNTIGDGSSSGNNNSIINYTSIGLVSLALIVICAFGFVVAKRRKRKDSDENLDPIYRESIYAATPIFNDSQSLTKKSFTNNSFVNTNDPYNMSGDNIAILTQPISESQMIDPNQMKSLDSNNPFSDTNMTESKNPFANSNMIVTRESDNTFSSQKAASAPNGFSEINTVGTRHTSLNTYSNVVDGNGNAIMANQNSLNNTFMATPIVEAALNSSPKQKTRSISSDNESTASSASRKLKINAVENNQISLSIVNGSDVSTNTTNVNINIAVDGDRSVSTNASNSFCISPINHSEPEPIYNSTMITTTTENSIQAEPLPASSQLTSTPILNNERNKKTISMLISEYSTDRTYVARYKYDPTMEDEMKISLNDVVFVNEIFNDGWSYGENLTTKSVGIFPINRLDPKSNPN